MFDSCVLSTLLYGCETWLSSNMKEVEKVYIKMIKILLGVRDSTPSANCLIEIGQKNLKTIVHERRKRFLLKKLGNCDKEEPFHVMLEICRLRNTGSYRMLMNSLNDLCDNGPSPKDICLGKNDNHTKFVIYRSVMNDELSVHPIYRKPSRIPDYQRVVFTRFRLTSHSLASEKGR